MINNILCATTGTQSVDPAVVVLIGIAVVFLILFFLIGIVKVLRFADGYLNKWDAMMLIVRGNRAEVEALKKSYIETRDDALNEVYINELNKAVSKADAKAEIAKIRSGFNTITKPIMLQAVVELKAKQKAKSLEVTTTEENCVAETEFVTDARIIAIITAAIAIATEQECAEKKVKFKVRTIKHLK